MTGEHREQVVELLRCAADIVHEERNRGPIASASDDLGITLGDAEADAYRARAAVSDSPAGDAEAYRAVLLEAAIRVEEGSWP